jgi:hypothetical protein
MSHKAPLTNETSTKTKCPEHRESNGRFAEGNRGGPGNPFARQVAALRKALINAVTGKDMADIVRVLIVRATSGDVAAAKLVLSYVIGKPAAAPNPDRMDVEELQHVQAEREVFTEMHKLQMTPEIGLAVNQVRCTRPAATRIYCDRMIRGLKELDERDKERQRQMALAEAARSTNGRNGAAQQEPQLASVAMPSTGIPAKAPLEQYLDANEAIRGKVSSNGQVDKSKNGHNRKDAGPSTNGKNGA